MKKNGKKLLSLVLALVMCLGLAPTAAADTNAKMVTTIAELDAIEKPAATAVTIKSGASIVSTKSYEFASLTIEEGATLNVMFLTCNGTLTIRGTLETQNDIKCFGSFMLTASGHVILGRTLSMYYMSKAGVMFNAAGTITYKHTDNMGGVDFWYQNVDTEQKFREYLNVATNDSDPEHTYWICIEHEYGSNKNVLKLTQDAVIPANTIVNVDPMNTGSEAGLIIDSGMTLTNKGSIRTNHLLYDNASIAVNGKLINDNSVQICGDAKLRDSLEINGEFVNNSTFLIEGDVTVNGSLVNNDRIPVIHCREGVNGGGQGTLTLGGGTYSGGGTIEVDYQDCDYTDCFRGLDFAPFDIDKREYAGVWFADLRLKDPGTVISGPGASKAPDVPDSTEEIKVLEFRPGNGEQLAVWNPSSLELRIVFDHGIEGFDFSKGTLSVYEYDTDTRIFQLHALSDGRPTPDVSLSYKDPRIMSVKTISNNLKLKPNSKYYVKLDQGFVKFTDTDSSIALEKGDWVFTTAKATYFSTTADITFENGYGKKTTTVSAKWDDAWFLSEATNAYNHDLATTSMALCGAAYSGGSDTRDALEKFGFTFIKSYNYGRKLSEDDCDYVSYTFGTKEIQNAYGAESAYVIAVVIRGTAREEWYSNFDIGYGPKHLGFAKAEIRLMADLADYLVEARRGHPGAKSTNKFLITGHSRGAAVANLLATELSYSDYATTDNVFAYTFATPRVSTNATESGYTNIFNIVTGEDFVPQVPLAKWGFKRYGIDLLLPSQSYYSSNEFFSVSEKAYEKFKDLTGKRYKEYNKDDDSLGMIEVSKVVSEMEKIAPDLHTYYTKKYETSVTPDTYFHDIFARMLVSGAEMDAANFASYLVGDYSAITKFFIANGKDIGSITQSRIFCAHCPAGYYSWMSACTAEELFGEYNGGARSTFKRLTVKCPVDVFVYNEDGTLVASIVDEKVVENTLAVSVEDGEKVIDLPGDQVYTVKTVATGDGTVSYSVDEMSASGGTSDLLRTVKFNEIAIQSGDELRGKVDHIAQTGASNYALTKNGTESIYADYDETFSSNEDTTLSFTDVPAGAWYHDAVYWAVEKKITKGTSETTFTPDRTCTQTEILTFLWRAAGEPESKAQLPFTVNKGLEYAGGALRWALEKGMIDKGFDQTAPCTRSSAVKFIWQAAGSPAAETSAAFTDVPAGAGYAQAVAWAVDKGVTNGTGAATFSPGDTCTRAQIVTLLYRAKAELPGK